MLSPSRQLPSVNRLSHLSTQAGIVCYCMQYTEPANSSQLTSFGFGFSFRVVDPIVMLNRFIFQKNSEKDGDFGYEYRLNWRAMIWTALKYETTSHRAVGFYS